MQIIRYTPQMKQQWDDLVSRCRNATFLHRRDYVDYHADRFLDHSLIAFDGRGRAVAALPANIEDSTLVSHRGLTYGGWLLTDRVDINAMLELWSDFCRYMTDCHITELIYKPVPHIYHRRPAEEDLYCLWRSGATLMVRNISSAVDLSDPIPFDQNARRKLGRVEGLHVGESDGWAQYWSLLYDQLLARHGAVPVHSLDEIMRLRMAFPENIRLVTAETPYGDIMAGAVFYVTDTTVHLQYAAASDRGMQAGVFPDLYRYVIQNICAGKRWLDFGTSNESAGRVLNSGLARQKSGFGGRGIAYDTYALKVNHLGI